MEYNMYIVQLCSGFQTIECKIQSTIVLQKSREEMHAVVLLLSQTANLRLECNETTPECQEKDLLILFL